MIDMKRTAAERKGEDSVMMTEDTYPYGLRLHLNEAEIEKLDMEMKAVGTELVIVAKVKISSTSSYETEDGNDRSMSLQITEMEIPNNSEDAKAERMYGDK